MGAILAFLLPGGRRVSPQGVIRLARKSPARDGATQQLRIIGGKWRSRRLSFADMMGLRPTGNRIRETLFNWLAPYIADARCLDAFAGSGALGFEALSRGAAEAVLVEKDAAACRYLQANKQQLDANHATIINQDVLHWLANAREEPFDIVFLDPPFSENLFQGAIDALHRRRLVAPGGLIYLESPLAEAFATPPEWHCIREKSGGSVRFRLLRAD